MMEIEVRMEIVCIIFLIRIMDVFVYVKCNIGSKL